MKTLKDMYKNKEISGRAYNCLRNADYDDGTPVVKIKKDLANKTSDLLQVKNMGPITFKKIMDAFSISYEKPINRQHADNCILYLKKYGYKVIPPK